MEEKIKRHMIYRENTKNCELPEISIEVKVKLWLTLMLHSEFRGSI